MSEGGQEILSLDSSLAEYGIAAIRADDRAYSEDLFTNIQTYIYGSRFAVDVFERILSDQTNPNVALEVGLCLGLRKPVCLLKERTLVTLQSDLMGRLYVEFDGQNIGETIPHALEGWLRDRSLFVPGHLRAERDA